MQGRFWKPLNWLRFIVAFLTSSAAGIGFARLYRALGEISVGNITQTLLEKYHDALAKAAIPLSDWLPKADFTGTLVDVSPLELDIYLISSFYFTRRFRTLASLSLISSYTDYKRREGGKPGDMEEYVTKPVSLNLIQFFLGLILLIPSLAAFYFDETLGQALQLEDNWRTDLLWVLIALQISGVVMAILSWPMRKNPINIKKEFWRDSAWQGWIALVTGATLLIGQI